MFFKPDRYHKMTDGELEQEAQRFGINQYGHAQSGLIDRKLIIGQLMDKDAGNRSIYTVVISVGALIISVISIIISLRF